MQCLCGCGRELSRSYVPLNLMAANLLAELVEYDRFRVIMRGAARQGGTEPENLDSTDTFIEDGANCYQQIIAVIHGELPIQAYDARQTRHWLKFSRKSRKKLARQTEGLIRGERSMLPRDEDWPYVDRAAPEMSFTRALTEDGRLLEPHELGDGGSSSDVDFSEFASDEGLTDDEGVPTCAHCGAQFISNEALLDHLTNAHSG